MPDNKNKGTIKSNALGDSTPNGKLCVGLHQQSLQSMQAMILAAGLGTRLYPLTLTTPKALAEVEGVPLLEIILRNLKRYGFRRVVVNIHHFAGQIQSFLESNQNFGLDVVLSDETGELLNTGGGLKNSAPLFDEGPILVHNVDILTSLNLEALYNHHRLSGAPVTLAVKERATSRSLIVGNNGYLCGWTDHTTGEIRMPGTWATETHLIAFSAIHVVERDVLLKAQETGAFSILDTYLRLAATPCVLTYKHNNDIWMDMGRLQNLQEAAVVLHQILQPGEA